MWMLILSACVSIALVMSLAFCLCWRKKAPKDEWLGLDGMVTQKNPDENVNHLPSAASCVVDGVESNGNTLDSKRNVVVNTRRSLPDIPSEQGAGVNWDPTDNSSEHYATVGQYQNSGKKNMLPNGVTRPSISQHSSISQADDKFSPYERVKYDKINSKEHPYAQVQPTTSRPVLYEETQASLEERITLLRPDDFAVSSSEPAAPPRSRRSSDHSSGGLDIPAATAVAGGIAASPELPYMTPPVTQANFSGDSQDSSKGYTSISVREPLANIIAQTKEMNKSKRELDPHYATVSDDSDDVYTTIQDPNTQIYTSESETYAKIPAHPITVEAEVNQPPPPSSESEEEVGDELYEAPPQPAPPSVDSLKQVTGHSHSRQASSSSSIANLGSPKPEKRQANSPLPPPPTASSFDFHADKAQVARNLDDLYAKVHKTKREETSDEKPSNHDDSLRNSVSSNNSIIAEENSSEKRKSLRQHDYETLKKSPRKTLEGGYEKIRNNTDEPGYASIHGPESLNSSDPGYEVLKDRALSDLDPNYEQLRHRLSNASDCGYAKVKENVSVAGYSIVKKKKNLAELNKTFTETELVLDEPNYESMPSEVNDQHYVKSSGSDTDPNYESVNQNEPNYESVKYFDPSYERLDEDSSRTNSETSGYEKIKSKHASSSNTNSEKTECEPAYERLNDDGDSDVGYEKIKMKSETSSGSSGNSVEPMQNELAEEILHVEDAIFEV